ncbi:MAG: hypothetical protein K2H13_09005 [Eubacterium sp.]|nr:hypothetical protein [Eubacterium sp.]
MKKKILAIIGIGIIATTMLAGCSSKDVDADATSSTESTSQITTVTTTTKPAESTTKPTETKADTTAPAKAPVNKTTAYNTTRSTTAATTEKLTTTEPTTESETDPPTEAPTVKNVSASEVQAQVNSYIRSKGYTVDSSLRPDNAGWSGKISRTQEALNNGRTLQLCKEYVDIEISNGYDGMTLYCYYDNSSFYILYL